MDGFSFIGSIDDDDIEWVAEYFFDGEEMLDSIEDTEFDGLFALMKVKDRLVMISVWFKEEGRVVESFGAMGDAGMKKEFIGG
ncbi:MAG: hypothetical protein ACRC2M_14160 [Planktothrix sp.]